MTISAACDKALKVARSIELFISPTWLRARFTNVDQAWTNFNQVQIRPWPRFSCNFCCTNAVQIKSQVKLGLTLNRRGRRIKLWSSVQLALNSGPRTMIPAIFSRLVTIGIKYICVGLLHPVSGYPSLNWITTLIAYYTYFNAWLRRG